MAVSAPVLAVLHTADLFRNPKMYLPTVRDWSKVRSYLNGSWPQPNPTYLAATSVGECVDWLDGALSAPVVAVDTEYSADTGFLFLVGLGYPGCDQVLQFDHRAAPTWERIEFGEELKRVVRTVPTVFQNAIADIPVLERAYGIKYEDYKAIDDTMLAHAVLWSDWPHTLEFLASIYGRHNKLKHLAATDPNLYNAGDVADTLSSWEALRGEFKSDPRSEGVYRNQSLRVVPIILKTQAKGLRVNKARVESAKVELAQQKEWATQIAQLYMGWPINVGSSQQLQRALYEIEGLPAQYVPRSKKVTVDDDAIAALRAFVGPAFDPDEEAKNGLTVETAVERIKEGAHPLLEARVVYAAAQQALSHYVLAMCGKDGQALDRVYPRILIHAQASGRHSTVDPPMAQIPKSLQDLVMPDEGERWIEFDLDQVELRLLAALSHDEAYQEAFRKGWDIHTLNCCDVFGWTHPEDRANPHASVVDTGWRERINWLGKDDPRRRFAKVFIFRLNYGGEAKTATDIPGVKQLGLKGADLIKGSISYLNKHPRIRQYWAKITEQGIAQREIRTFMGRRRRLLVDGRAAMKRLIYNHPMQGGVSDVFNTLLVKIQSALPQARFVFGVHDNQKWAVKADEYDACLERVKEIVHEPWNIDGEMVVLPATFKKG